MVWWMTPLPSIKSSVIVVDSDQVFHDHTGIVYFPAGAYLINSSIINYYYTQLIDNPNSPAVIKATAGFSGLGLVDGDGQQGWISTNVFYHQIRNLVFYLTAIPPTSAATGILWPSVQGTSIQSVVIRMTQDAGSQHQGLFIENGKPPASPGLCSTRFG
jgi:glucan 1,3-beta-glucosidase